MKNQLINFISQDSFPCMMAKMVAKKGNLCVKAVEEIEETDTIQNILSSIYDFIENYRQSPQKVHSFVVVIRNKSYFKFNIFEKVFWSFLIQLNELDKKKHIHDRRVGSDHLSKNFSYSIMQEAFFILALHPQSPRLSRRYQYPTIVFNPHQQFEKLRENGSFRKIRNLIRKKDKILQGNINPMLNDFGEESEIFQYMGRTYKDFESIPFLNVRAS